MKQKKFISDDITSSADIVGIQRRKENVSDAMKLVSKLELPFDSQLQEQFLSDTGALFQSGDPEQDDRDTRNFTGRMVEAFQGNLQDREKIHQTRLFAADVRAIPGFQQIGERLMRAIDNEVLPKEGKPRPENIVREIRRDITGTFPSFRD